MNTKPIPVIITLAAAFISCVISIYQHVEFGIFVKRLTLVVLIFLFMGTVIKILLDYSFKTLEPTVVIDEPVEAPAQENPATDEPKEDVETTEESSTSESEEG